MLGAALRRSWTCAPLLLLVACNVVTGAAGLDVDDRDDNHNEGIDGLPGGTTSATGGGGGATTGSGAGGAVQSGPLAPADGVTITEIALYQGVERMLMQGGGSASSGVPIVANRDALVRVFYATDGGYNGQPVTARLSLGAEVIEVTTGVSGTSSKGQLSSTVNLDVPGSALAAGSYRIDLLQPTATVSGQNGGAVYPAVGQEGIAVQSAGAQLKLVLLPIAYAADGSNRLPDTSAGQVQRYRDTLYKMYPVPEVVVTVRQPVSWSKTISPFGQGWNELLNYVVSYRQQNGAKADEYYYGIFASEASFSAYCAGGCIAGLSLLAQSPTDAQARAGIGVGFSGQSSADTAAHEIGHQHGRGHSPCGTNQGLDPSFPNGSGAINVWGYDLVKHTLISPQSYRDYMSYCDPPWVSDYTFGKLFTRIKQVNGASYQLAAEPVPYVRLDVGPDGRARRLADLGLRLPPSGAETQVTLRTARGGEARVTGHFYPYSHLPGGVLLFQRPPGVVAAQIGGELVPLTD